ncbi:hypothetical protein [Atopobacter phocae]|uniref:hypothetical protein n=1 Tax=Atopobacter phocae TaxID=136492 RepID=UPI000470058A|nr:hypothetical protein [Atopobacter phocae]
MYQSKNDRAQTVQFLLFHPVVHMVIYPLSFILFGIIMGSRINMFRLTEVIALFLYVLTFYLLDLITKRTKSIYSFIRTLQGIIGTLVFITLSFYLGQINSIYFMLIMCLNGLFLFGKEWYQKIHPFNHVYVTWIRAIYYGLIFNGMALYTLGHVILFSKLGLMLPLVLLHWVYLKVRPHAVSNDGLLKTFKAMPYLIVILGILIKFISVYSLPFIIALLGLSVFGQKKLLPDDSLVSQRVFISYEILVLSFIVGVSAII